MDPASSSDEEQVKDICRKDFEPKHLETLDRDQTSSSIANLSLPREIAIVVILSVAQFSTQFGVGSTLAIIYKIGDHFECTEPGELSWFMAAYSLTVGTFILPSGRCGDVFGHKTVLLIGFVWFAVWSVVVGLSAYASSGVFTFARAMQGIGPAICLPNALAILASMYTKGKKKDMMFAVFGSTAPVGSVVGAVVASLFEKVDWPWTFYSLAIFLSATVVWGFFLLPSDHDMDEHGCARHDVLKRLDPAGSVVGVAALVLINFAWNQAPLDGWSSPQVITTLIVGVLLVPLFFKIEASWSAHPLLSTKSLSGDIGIILACVACGWACFGIWLYYTWQFFLELRHATPVLATAWYSTNALSGVAAAILTGLLLGRVGPAPAMVMAMLAFLVGTILIATATVSQTYWTQTFLCLIIIPFGMDISFPAATVMISDAVPSDQQGLAASLVNTVVNYSISLALGIAGTVDKQVDEAQMQQLTGYRSAWYLGMGFSGLGVLVSMAYWTASRRRISS